MIAKTFIDFVKGNLRVILLSLIFFIAVAAHILVLLFVTYNKGIKEKKIENEVFKIVDVEEFVPPPVVEQPKEEEEEKIEEVIVVPTQEEFVEDVIETEEEIVETRLIDYVPQHKISEPPILPLGEIKSKIIYPPLARKEGIEGVVYFLLYIDRTGIIRKIEVLKDPGYGFKDAALKALKEVNCIPALANGEPIATKYRYPIRFSLN